MVKTVLFSSLTRSPNAQSEIASSVRDELRCSKWEENLLKCKRTWKRNKAFARLLHNLPIHNCLALILHVASRLALEMSETTRSGDGKRFFAFASRRFWTGMRWRRWRADFLRSIFGQLPVRLLVDSFIGVARFVYCFATTRYKNWSKFIHLRKLQFWIGISFRELQARKLQT